MSPPPKKASQLSCSHTRIVIKLPPQALKESSKLYPICTLRKGHFDGVVFAFVKSWGHRSRWEWKPKVTEGRNGKRAHRFLTGSESFGVEALGSTLGSEVDFRL